MDLKGIQRGAEGDRYPVILESLSQNSALGLEEEQIAPGTDSRGQEATTEEQSLG